MRIKYYPYTEWECYQRGMYRNCKPAEISSQASACVSLFGDTKRLEDAMFYVCRNWPKSGLSQVADGLQNHRPWVGQSACCFELGATEVAVRLAWASLPLSVQAEANAIADDAFSLFLCLHCNQHPYLPRFFECLK